MTENRLSTRRRFFTSAGAALSVPLVAGASGANRADAAEIPAGDPGLARREATAAVRDLTHTLAFSVIAGDSAQIECLFVDPRAAAELESVRRIVLSGVRPDEIELGTDCTTARFESTVAIEFERRLDADGTLAQMARAQDTDFVRTTESRQLSAECARSEAGWQFVSLRLRRIA